MEPNVESAQHYYNPQRRRSFFYSRLFVVLSMLVLVVVLTINISVLYSQERTSTTTQASNGQTHLPTLPKGCSYLPGDKGKGVQVVCATTTPVASAAPSQATPNNAAVTVVLPNLPPQCQYELSRTVTEVKCSSANAPIPTVQVPMPTVCPPSTATSNANCREADNPSIQNQLPTLPKGCEYKTVGTKYFISCVGTVAAQN